MTKVNLHGLLAFEFGKSMTFSLKRPKDVLYAINANKKNFYNKVIELSQIGCHYSIIVDGEDIKNLNELDLKKEPKVIDLVPVIIGTGSSSGVLGGVLAVVGIVAMFIPGLQGVGIALIGMGVQMMLTPKSTSGAGTEPPKAAIGTASAINQSFYFSNIANLAQQGAPVPLGYGRLKIGSSVIQESSSSYSILSSSNEKKYLTDPISSINNQSKTVVLQTRN
jgi:predicted phage tail protein